MSQENVAVVQAGFDTWNAGDMDAYRELLDPDVAVRVPPEWPEQGPFEGREAVMGEYLRLRDTWDFDQADPISGFIHAADRVVGRFRFQARGLGPNMNMELSCIYTVRHGKVTCFEYFWDHAEALEAAGLSE